jgi:hypothetical protein
MTISNELIKQFRELGDILSHWTWLSNVEQIAK